MHRRRWAITLLVAATLAGAATSVVPAGADPVAGAAATSRTDPHGPRDRDNRTGVAAPTAAQRAAAGRLGVGIRWNPLGTPHALGPVAAGLARGLPADPEAAARRYLSGNRDLFGFDESAVSSLERLLVQPIGAGAIVVLRQRFGSLPAGHDGLVSVAVSNGTVVRVSSSLSRDARAPEPATLSPEQAYEVARRDAGLAPEQVQSSDTQLVAVPTPAAGPRAAYAVTLVGGGAGEPAAFTTYVDARTGGILIREDLIDHESDNPQWAVFEATPASGDRVIYCLSATAGCVREVRDPNSGQAWDVDLATGAPTFTSRGNSAVTFRRWGAGTPDTFATVSPTRDYIYPFTDQWHAARCNPSVYTSTQRNDTDAAVANLFAMHNRMHDWSYHLGFTEATWNLQAVNLTPDGLGGDAEQGRAQSNALGGSRNNASQGTPRDGLVPTTNMFLWQPIAGSAYPPCVDGDYDMTVIGHEYTHAITNRMVAGPNTGIQSFQGGAMGESWSDLFAAEILAEYGLRPPGETPFITGGYVTGNLHHGIRNYDMSRSPLNYSNVGYDRSGPGVHADGEIWSATNIRIRNAFLARYGAGTPALQARCADGLESVDSCPGNRRWIQLAFDALLLQASSQFSMVDMRDNMLAADLVRFGGANQDILWNGFAQSGLGQGAASGPDDTDPTPSFASPYADNATVTLRPLGQATGAVVRLYVGDYEARAVPVADTDPATSIPDTFSIMPDTTFSFLAVGAGRGHQRLEARFTPGAAQELKLVLPRNLASTASGAVFSGDGVNLDRLGDDTEATNWASLDGVAGKQVTVDLAGKQPQLISEVRVSAMLRPAISGDPDAGSQNAFSALRSFEILACLGLVADCSQDSGYRVVYTSAPDAFPAGTFRPYSPEINLRTFQIHPTEATHLRLRVLASQCTGGPQYAGEQDDDPTAATDCATASPFAAQVRIAELQAFLY
ncbi:MAG TPA: M36 family metallopeptidase [Micromonosporaceae bacterium]|nr:M36 family metallopeptidase [Micromonosporaceae bacterium]